MTEFGDLSRSAQLRSLRRAASDALDAYGWADASRSLVVHDFNTTYRVERPGGGRAALRVNVNSVHGVEAVRAEAAFVEHVRSAAAAAGVDVAAPVATLDGELAVEVHVDGLGPCAAVMYRWLGGRTVGRRARPVHAAAIGRAAATIHRAARSLDPGVTAARHRLDTIFMDSPNRLHDLDAPWYPAAARVVIEAAIERATERCAGVLAGRGAVMLHGDLHGWNVRWSDGRLGVFDFDDCGVGAPVFELAIAAYYFGSVDGAVASLLGGYGDAGGTLEVDDRIFESLVASRQLLLLNDLVGSSTADHRTMLAEYVGRAERRLERWLETDRFRLDA